MAGFVSLPRPKPIGWRLKWEIARLERRHEARRLRVLRRYLKEVLRLDRRAQRQVVQEVRQAIEEGRLSVDDPEAFARGVLRILRRRHPQVLEAEGLAETVQREIALVYRVFRLADRSPLREEGFLRGYTAADQRAVDFLSRFDHFLLSRYVDNRDFQAQLREEMIQMAQEGLDADTIAERLSRTWWRIGHRQIRRIVDTGVTRARTFAHVRQMAEAGVSELEVVEVMDRITCEYCREMDGKVVSVARVDAFVREALASSPQEFEERFLHPPDLEAFRSTPIERLVAQGRGIPPFHPYCRGRVRMHIHMTRRQAEVERGLRIPDRYPTDPGVNYADYGKKVVVVYWERNERQARRRTLLWSVKDPLGNQVYFSREAERHIRYRGREEILPELHRVLQNPDAIYVDREYGDDTHAYVKRIRGKFLFVSVKKGNAKVVATAFMRRRLPRRLEKIWGETL